MHSSTSRNFQNGISIRRASFHSSLSRSTSLGEGALHDAASAMRNSNGLRRWPVTLLWVLQYSLQQRRNNASNARRSSERSRKSGGDANWRRASSTSKLVELPDLRRS